MNATDKGYKKVIESLQAVETAIEQYQAFCGRLLSGNATGVCLSLRMDKEKVETVDPAAEESGAAMIQQYFSWRTMFSTQIMAEAKTIDTPHHPLDEKIAIQICNMVLGVLTQERTRLLRVLGVLAAHSTEKP